MSKSPPAPVEAPSSSPDSMAKKDIPEPKGDESLKSPSSPTLPAETKSVPPSPAVSPSAGTQDKKVVSNVPEAVPVAKTEGGSEHSTLSRSPPERTYSGSSSVAGVVVDVKATIDGQISDEILQPVEVEKGGPRDPIPLGVNVVQFPVSDSASLGSVPSMLDSVGAATLAEQRLHVAQSPVVSNQTIMPSTTNSQQTPIAGHLNHQTNVCDRQMPPPAADQPQHIQPEHIVSQTAPLLVAVPLQQSSPERMQQQINQGTTQENNTEYTQTQQTVLYQIPGVVTLPQSNHVVNSSGQVHRFNSKRV